MCGIAGYIGKKPAQNIVLDCLKKLEYRGYDSAGVGYLLNNGLYTVKVTGGVDNLKQALQKNATPSSVMIGHTRWATHGKVCTKNAHPQISENKKIAVVHNGIIENFLQLKQTLYLDGINLVSDTDTEVIPNLIMQKLKGKAYTIKNVLNALNKVLPMLKGSFALCILIDNLNCLFVVTKFSPLVIGKTNTGFIVASDVVGLPQKAQVYKLKDNTLGLVFKDDFKCYNFNLEPVIPQKLDVKNNGLDTDIKGFSSFMEKEINQGPSALLNTAQNILYNNALSYIPKNAIESAKTFFICACGTALHAGRVLGYLLQKYCGIFCVVDYASEFRYKNSFLDKHSFCIFISQSGETADTLGCLELAKQSGAFCLGITNVYTSRISNMVDYCLFTSAGTENSVASTKAYIAQLCSAFLLTEWISKVLGKNIDYSYKDLLDVALCLKEDYYLKLQPVVNAIKDLQSLYILGRDIDYITAQEGALKIKEVSYIHCEAMPLGELKHGSLALFNNTTYAIVLLTKKELTQKVISNIIEMQSRGAHIILITSQKVDIVVDFCIYINNKKDVFSPFVATKVLQQLALLLAKQKNLNVDKPRNLAKSVTVE